MKDIILCFKLIKYGLQFKLMCILGAAFFGLGILFEIQGTGTTNLGGIYMSLAGLYVFQLAFTPSIAKLVQTSPYKKKIQTLGTTFLSVFCCLISYTIHVIIRVLKAGSPDFANEGVSIVTHYSALINSAVIAAILLIYIAFSFKMYLTSLILCITFVLIFMFVGFNEDKSPFIKITELLMDGGDSPLKVILASYGIIIAGGIICYFTSCLLYKHELSSLAVKNAMRQSLK